MKPFPILLAAAGIAVAAAGSYMWMAGTPAPDGSGTNQGPQSTVSQVSSFTSSGQETTSGVVAGPVPAPASRIGRSFRASDDEKESVRDVAATARETASVTVKNGGISTENLHAPRGRGSTTGTAYTRTELANGIVERAQPAAPLMASANIGFGALATTTPGADAGQEASSGILSHPGIVPPAPPRLAGVPVAQLAAGAGDGDAAPVSINSQPAPKGQRPPWPTGPFTPEQELYRAQVGSENFNHWLNEEALKQRGGM
jgi:hypothetical protein